MRRAGFIALICLGALVAAPAALAASPWSGSGTGTTHTVADGTSGPAQFTYSYVNPCTSCGATGSWTFSTTSTTTSGPQSLAWSYTGFHAYFEVRVGLSVFVKHGTVTTTTPLVSAGPANCCTTPSGGFSYAGTTTVTVSPGDTYGFMLTGSNFDSNATLSGTLTVTATALQGISTTATPGPVALGTSITDSATLTGAGGAGGTIAFRAYGDSLCTAPAAYSAELPVTGDGTYTAPGFTPTTPGTYYWTATYSGGASEGCGGTNESTKVVAPPSLGTTPTPGPVPLGTTIGDSASLSGTQPGAGGTITFKAYFADAACATTPAYTQSVAVSGNGTYAATGFQATSPGTYIWTASYSGDPGSGTLGATVGCAAGAATNVAASNDAWTRAKEITLDQTGLGTASDSIDFSGEPRWYKVAVTPGSTVQVDLSNLPANYNLSLFGDIGQEEANLTSSPPDLQELGAQTPGVAASPYAISPYAISPYAISPYAISPYAISPWAISPYAISPYAISPYAISPYAISPYAISPWAISPWAISPYAISGLDAPNVSAKDYDEAQVLSLLAVSQNPGTAGQHVFENVWNPQVDQVNASGPSYFYILVDGNNGAYAPGSPFKLTVHEQAGACGGVTPSSAPLLNSAVPGSGYKTLILTDESRLTDDGHKAAMETDLHTFANNTSVNGVVVDVGASPKVTELQQQADLPTNTGCPYAENLVASSIREIVGKARTANPGLKYIVIVGNDHTIPFFRYSDTAPAASTESGFNPPVLPTSTSFASLQSNDFLSQDAYGSTTVLNINGQELPIPGLPVGRLVDTPSEIDGLLQAYLGLGNGVVPTPTSSLVTGYDFMTKTADAVADDLSAGIGNGTGTQNDTLIQPDGDSPAVSWTASQLNTKLTASRHDLIFLGGHFSAGAALAADFSTTMNASQLASSSVNLANSIVFSAGCHAGYNIPGSDSVPNVTQSPDWVEAFAQKQATLIAGTGYQYGDTDFLAYSDQLYADFSHELLTYTGGSPGPVAVGAALVQAKQDYLDGTGGTYPNRAGTGVDQSNPIIPSNAVTPATLGGIDIKSLLEATLYGLPMISVNLPHGRIQVTSGSSAVPGTDPAPAGTPGGALGLSSFDITRSETFTTHTTQLTNTGGGGSGVSTTYLEGPSGDTTSPGAPALPLDTADATVNGLTLRGVGFRGGTYNDVTGITPLTGAPATDLNGVHYTFGSNVFYPSRLATVNYLGGLADGSSSTQLVVTPAQYRSDAPGSATDTQRSYSSVGLRLFYSGNTTTYGSNTPALAAPPAISRVDASVDAGTVTFQAHVVGDPVAGIQEVWVTYTGVDVPSGASGEWESIDLTQDTSDPTLWIGSLDGLSSGQIQDMSFIVQAVNGVGLVSLDDNQGAYYTPGQIAPALLTAPTTLTPTSLQLNSPSPTSGSYGSSVNARATLTGPGALSGQPVTFTIGSSTVYASTDSSGVASAQVPLTNNPGGQYQLSASFAGTATLAGSSTTPAPFSIQRLPTTLTLGGDTSANYSGAGKVTATLAYGATGLAQYLVVFRFTPTNGTPGPPVVQTAMTGGDGAASIAIGTQLLAGTYSVQAFFGPGGPVTVPDDPIFVASAAAASHLTVVDAHPPKIAGVVTPAPNGGGWNNTSVTVSFNCTGDPGVVITFCSPATQLGAGKAQSVTGTATDAAGTSVTKTVSVNVDLTAPVVSITGVANGATYASAPHPACATTDPLSGVGTAASLTVVAGTGALTGTFTATCAGAADVAGNAGAAVSVTYSVVSPLGSGTTTCNGAYSGTGNQIVVPAGATCRLLVGTKVTGNVQVNQGGVLIDEGATISGNVQVTNATAVTVLGGSIGGNLQIQGVTGSPAGANDSVCNTKISGNVTVQSNGPNAPFDIGNLGACSGGAGLTVGGNLVIQGNAAPVTVGGNTVSGGLQVQSNSAKVTVSANKAKGNIQIQSNTKGGGTLTGNATSGSCQLQGNNPKIAGSGNTAVGSNTCNTTA